MEVRSVFACIIWFLKLATCTLASVTASPKGGTRCFCNDVSCVRTGYMCKSLLGSCFSVLVPADGGQGFRSKHGCSDTLPETVRGACVKDSEENTEKEAALFADGSEKLFCCRQDMCNYMEGGGVFLLSTFNNNSASAKDRPAVLNNVSPEHSQRDLWFRVAVITVPLIGFLILILLVTAAVRMLRSDMRRHQVGHSRTVMAGDFCERFVHDRHSTRSQNICEGFCLNHGYPLCWVDISDKNCCDAKNCKHHACSLGPNCARIYPVETQAFISFEKLAPLNGKLGKASAVRPSSHIHVPIATV